MELVGVLDGLQIVLNLLGEPSQLVITGQMGVFTPEDRYHDGHIIDLDGLDHPGLDSGRNTICLREYLVVDLDQGVLSVLSHVKADRNHTPLGHGHGVDILHTIDLIEEFLKGCGDLALHLLGAKTRC